MITHIIEAAAETTTPATNAGWVSRCRGRGQRELAERNEKLTDRTIPCASTCGSLAGSATGWLGRRCYPEVTVVLRQSAEAVDTSCACLPAPSTNNVGLDYERDVINTGSRRPVPHEVGAAR
jgi:hypothetical protein